VAVLADLYEIHCSGCRQRIGYAEYEKSFRNSVYCSIWCYEQPVVTDMEDRNDLWKAMKATGVSPHHISKLFGVAHSLVYRTVKRG
jgi:hypothetical protein